MSTKSSLYSAFIWSFTFQPAVYRRPLSQHSMLPISAMQYITLKTGALIYTGTAECNLCVCEMCEPPCRSPRHHKYPWFSVSCLALFDLVWFSLTRPGSSRLALPGLSCSAFTEAPHLPDLAIIIMYAIIMRFTEILSCT